MRLRRAPGDTGDAPRHVAPGGAWCSRAASAHQGAGHTARRWLALLGALCLAGCAAPGLRTPAPPPIALHLDPVIADGAVTAFEATLRFQGARDGRTVLQLPDDWGGERALYRSLDRLRAEGATLEPAAPDQPARRTLVHAPGAAVTLQWRINPSPQPPKAQGNDYQVRIGPRLFHLLGNAIVIAPQHLPDDTPARFGLGALPAGQQWASDLEHGTRGRALRLSDLVDSVIIGGDLRVIDAGGGARLALHGQVNGRSDAQWQAAFTAIARAQRAFWQAADEPFLVTVWARAADAPGHVSIGGTGRGDAFAFFATDNAPAATLDAVLSHEMMHSWVPGRIGGLPDGPAQVLAYWLSEGFTDWAHRAALVAGGYWTPRQWIDAVNEQLGALDRSRVRSADNAHIGAAFWQDPEVQALPYQRGALLGLWWDHRIRQATGGRAGLRTVLLHMQAMDRRQPALRAVDRLRQAAREVAGLELDADLQRHVQAGEPVTLPEDLIAPCGRLRTVERPVFDRGFDIQATVQADNQIRGVRRDSPAWAAGLRDGMRLVARHGGEIGNAERDITYEVHDDGQTRFITYRPAGAGTERFRRFEPAPAAGPADGVDSPACRERLGGG